MSVGTVGYRPLRGSLSNLHSGEAYDFPMNPNKLIEEVTVNYAEQAVIGMSHPILQYQNTGSANLPGVVFRVDARHLATEREQRFIDGRSRGDFWRFVLALTVPPLAPQTIAGGAPPRVLFVWPEVLILTCVVKRARRTIFQFDHQGAALVYDVDVSFSEIRDIRINSEDMRFSGSERALFGGEIGEGV